MSTTHATTRFRLLAGLLLAGALLAISPITSQASAASLKDRVTATSGLIDYWRFSEDTGTTFANEVTGAPALTGGSLTTTSDGVSGRGLQMTYATTPNGPAISTGAGTSTSFTWEWWIKAAPAVGQQTGFWLGKDKPATFGLFTPGAYSGFNTDAQGKWCCGTLLSNASGGTLGGTAGLKPGQWNQIVMAVQGSPQRIFWYVNGAWLRTNNVAAGNNWSNATDVPFHIGLPSGITGNSTMPGVIDEVSLYNRTLTDAEILDHYTADKAETNPNDPLTCDTQTLDCKQIQAMYNSKKLADAIEACETAHSGSLATCNVAGGLNVTGMAGNWPVVDAGSGATALPRVEVNSPTTSGSSDYQVMALISFFPDPHQEFWAERVSGAHYYSCGSVTGRCLSGASGSPGMNDGHWAPLP